MSYFICIAIIVLALGCYAIFRKCINRNLLKISKVFSGIIAVAFFVRYFASSDSVFESVFALSRNNPFSSSFLCFLTAISVWLEIASVVIVCLNPYFKNSLLKNYLKTFCLISSGLNVITLRWTIYSFTGSYGISLCGVVMAIEVALVFVSSLRAFVAGDGFKMSKKEVKDFFIFLPLVLIFSAPPYLFGTLFGNFGQYMVKGLDFYHRIYIYLAFAMLIIVYQLLKNRDREFARMILLYISLVTLISYCYDYDFSRFVTPTQWPLHLCNTAMFILPLCLIFKWNWLYYFTLIINVVGAFLAMLMPNYDIALGFLSCTTVRFWINHIMAFAMPILIVMLKIYERPRWKHFLYSMIGFVMYFALVLVVNAWFSNYGTTVDFFFINSDFVASKLGETAEATRDIVASFKIGSLTFTFYPLYQFLYFCGYVALGFAMWFLYVWLFQVQDLFLHAEERQRKIRVEEYAICQKYDKTRIGECMNAETQNKLVVSHLYKRYGKSKEDSAQDVTFEAHAGEILGFLGANGAGKSTTIKCIVGIHPITKGTIEINGYDVERQPVEAKMQIGFVPDHYALYEKLTGREYINYVADLYKVTPSDRNERLENLLKKLNMSDAIDNQIQTYSHGMKQKIAIMSALIHNPKLWILDEPLTGLDPTSIFEVKECMKEHARSGNIVFFSSHLIDVVEKLCDRIIIIKNGRIIASATLDELNEQNIDLEKYYLEQINKPTPGDLVSTAVDVLATGAEPASVTSKETKIARKNKRKLGRRKAGD